MAIVPSPWARKNSPLLVSAQGLVVAFAEHTTGAGGLGADQILNSTDIFTPAAGASLGTPTAQFHNDSVARCLGVSLLKQVAAGGYTVRITGKDGYGRDVTEDVTWAAATAAGAALHHIFTRYPYRQVTSVAKIASSGTPDAADRVRIGLSPVAAGFPGTIINPQPNAAQVNQYRGCQLPIDVSAGTNPAGVASTLFTSEVWGVKVTELAVTAGTSAPITRGAGWFVDPVYGIWIWADADLPIAPAATTDGVKYFVLGIQTNRGE